MQSKKYNKNCELIQIPVYRNDNGYFYTIIGDVQIDVEQYINKLGYKITNLNGSLGGTNYSTYKLFTFILEKRN